MRQSVRICVGVLLLIPLTSAARAQEPADGDEPAPAAPKAGAPKAGAPKAIAPKAIAPAAGRPARPDEVLATVNDDKVTRKEVINFLNHLEIEPGKEKLSYRYAVDTLINTKLLNQFLASRKVAVPEKEVEAEVARTAKDIKERTGTDLATALAKSDISMPELRTQLAERLRWNAFLQRTATDPVLAKFVESHKDQFNKTEVRASHILITVDPDAPEAERAKARQRLLALKKEIESGKLSFAEAADKYSQDKAEGESKNGGDLDYFPRRGVLPEALAAAAFSMKKGQLSNPIDTEYGIHLVQVTDRREGAPVDPARLLKQFREEILSRYAFDLQSQIVADRRKSAKIQIKDMPADILPPTPLVVPPQPPSGRGPAAPKAAPPR